MNDPGTRLGIKKFNFIQLQTTRLAPVTEEGKKGSSILLSVIRIQVDLPRLRRVPRSLDKLGNKKLFVIQMHRLTYFDVSFTSIDVPATFLHISI